MDYLSVYTGIGAMSNDFAKMQQKVDMFVRDRHLVNEREKLLSTAYGQFVTRRTQMRENQKKMQEAMQAQMLAAQKALQ